MMTFDQLVGRVALLEQHCELHGGHMHTILTDHAARIDATQMAREHGA